MGQIALSHAGLAVVNISGMRVLRLGTHSVVLAVRTVALAANRRQLARCIEPLQRCAVERGQMKPFLTIGMATHNDFNGVYFTIQALRLSNGPLDEVEFLVVDNAPDTKHGKAVAGIMGRFAPGSAGARYIPMGEVQGTAAPRQRVFDEAQIGRAHV